MYNQVQLSQRETLSCRIDRFFNVVVALRRFQRLQQEEITTKPISVKCVIFLEKVPLHL